MKKLDPKNTIFLIDGSSFLYRAYYSLRPLYTSKGVPVQAVFGFARMIKRMIDKFKPYYISVVWDSSGKTVRHEIYEEYKATRQAPPSDLFEQKEFIQEFADLIDLHQIAQQGIEADDLMYSIAKDWENKGKYAVLITSDKDMGQAISDNIFIFDPFKEKTFGRDEFAERMGFPVEKLPFYFSLLGDASDNIPGVRGVGKKGALELVQQFDSLEDLYSNLDKVKKPRTRNTLETNKENAFLSKELFLLKYYDTNVEDIDFAFEKKNWVHAKPLFERLELKSLLKDIEKIAGIKIPVKKLSDTKGYNFITITSESDMQSLIKDIKEKKLMAIDTELDGLRPLQNNVIGLCICIDKGTAYYIPFCHTTGEQQLSQEHVLTAFKPILEDPSIKKIMHHAKFDQLSLLHYGIKTKGLIFDTLIAAQLVTEDWQRIGLKHLSKFYLDEDMLTFGNAVTDNGYKTFAEVPLELATEYAAADAHQTFQLYPILLKALHDQKMETLYKEIEFPLIDVLTEMEATGIYCDTSILQALDEKITQDLHTIREKIVSFVGDEFKNINLNSPKQLGHLLFIHLELPPFKKKKTGYSTDVTVLIELAKIHPIPQLILQYRSLFKLKSTYVEALPQYINPETGRIHTTFSQTGVATGRLSSSNPNMQNIPTNTTRYKNLTLRSAFEPKEGNAFLSADYSQIELRVLAYLSQDEALKKAFDEGRDIHTDTASKLFDVPLENVTHEQRQLGKRINFSILYGLTPFGLSKDLDIPFKEAKHYIEKYFAQYPKVSLWMEQVIKETKDHGYVTTYWGRRRYIPGIYEDNRHLYELAKRIAINTKAQGTAAEIMKKGMIDLDKALKKEKIDAQLLLQIHDELLISVSKEQKEKAEAIVKQTLENVIDWNVPLEITTRFGKNWQDVTK